MSVFRKTVLASAILGAGLASTAGLAAASPSHHGGGCSNEVAAASENSAGRTLGDTVGGGQELSGANTCDLLNGNVIGSANNTAGDEVRNGDDTDIDTTRTRTDTATSTTDLS